MDLSEDPEQQAWLERRREMVASASKRIRQRRKQEREQLDEENAALRGERARLLHLIAQLEAQVGGVVQKADEGCLSLENARLRQELAAHQAFLLTVYAQLPQLDPSVGPSELSRENRESTMLHFLRLLAESQENREGRWRQARLERDIDKSIRVLARYCPRAFDRGGGFHLRFDVCIHNVSPSAVARALVRTWEDLDSFVGMFGDGLIAAIEELVDFRVQRDRETLTAYYRKHAMRDETLRARRAAVYFVAKGTSVLNRSTLDAGVSEERAALTQRGEEQQLVKRKRQQLAPAVFGSTECHFGMRSITDHGTLGGDQQEDTVRVSSGITEGIFCWGDEDGRTRAAWMLTVPKDVAENLCLAEELGSHNSMGRKMTMFLGRWVESLV